MPGGDGRGPVGMGPLTGRGAGYCAGFGMPGFANPAGGRGWGGLGGGRGRGGGRGARNQFWATGMPGWMRAGWGVAPSAAPAAPAPEMEKQILENQVAALQAQLEVVRKRLDEVSAQAEPKG